MMCDGTQVIPTGAEKVDRTWSASAIRGNFPNMSAVVDPKNTLVFWMMPDKETPDKAFTFNWMLGPWSTASVTAERLFSGMWQNLTLAGLDAIYPSSSEEYTSELQSLSSSSHAGFCLSKQHRATSHLPPIRTQLHRTRP